MDLINSSISMVGEAIANSSPTEVIQRITWRTPGNGYALRTSCKTNGSHDRYTPNNDPGGLTEAINTFQGNFDYFPSIRLESNAKFSLNIDWGDGTVETYEAVYGSNTTYLNGKIVYKVSNYYLAYIGVHLVEGHENDDCFISKQSHQSGGYSINKFTDQDSIPIKGIPNHKYADNKVYNVVIKITRGNIDNLRIISIFKQGYVIPELPNLISLSYNTSYEDSSLPFNLFTYLRKLRELNLNGIVKDYSLTTLPDSLFNLVNLTFLSLNFLLKNSGYSNGAEDAWEKFNLDRISNLKSLKSLRLRGFSLIKKFPNVLNTLPNLVEVGFGSNGQTVECDYSECTGLGNISSLTDCEDWGNDNIYIGWDTNGTPYHTSLANATHVDVSNLVDYPFLSKTLKNNDWGPIPDNFSRFYGITNRGIFGSKHAGTQAGVDSLVNRMYEMTLKHPMSATEDNHPNIWYNMVTTINYQNNQNGKTPQGVYQAPEGFVQGSNNGNPTTPMEKIYVMTHNYNQVWTIYSSEYPSDVNPYKLFKEGTNYYYQYPGSLVLGHLDFIQEFETLEDLENYCSENGIKLLNLSSEDS